jgi:hypothetical protein
LEPCGFLQSAQLKKAGEALLPAIEEPINAKAEQIRAKFQALLDKTNKEDPRPQDVKALSDSSSR